MHGTQTRVEGQTKTTKTISRSPFPSNVTPSLARHRGVARGPEAGVRRGHRRREPSAQRQQRQEARQCVPRRLLRAPLRLQPLRPRQALRRRRGGAVSLAATVAATIAATVAFCAERVVEAVTVAFGLGAQGIGRVARLILGLGLGLGSRRRRVHRRERRCEPRGAAAAAAATSTATAPQLGFSGAVMTTSADAVTVLALVALVVVLGAFGFPEAGRRRAASHRACLGAGAGGAKGGDYARARAKAGVVVGLLLRGPRHLPVHGRHGIELRLHGAELPLIHRLLRVLRAALLHVARAPLAIRTAISAASVAAAAAAAAVHTVVGTGLARMRALRAGDGQLPLHLL